MSVDPTASEQEHWDAVWTSKRSDEVSWFQQSAEP